MSNELTHNQKWLTGDEVYKPCPFCKGTNIDMGKFYHLWMGKCMQCYMQGPTAAYPRLALTMWDLLPR